MFSYGFLQVSIGLLSFFLGGKCAWISAAWFLAGSPGRLKQVVDRNEETIRWGEDLLDPDLRVSGEFEHVWNAGVFFWGPQNWIAIFEGEIGFLGCCCLWKKVFLLTFRHVFFWLIQDVGVCFCSICFWCWWRYRICNSTSGWAVWMAKWRANWATTVDGGLGTGQIALYSRIIICAEVLSLNSHCFPMFFNPHMGPICP